MRERANRRTTATCRLRFAPTQIAEYRNFGMWQNVICHCQLKGEHFVNCEILVIGKKQINSIKTLWEKLNEIHLKDSTHFKDHYRYFTFEERCEKFDEIKNSNIRIEVIIDNNKTVGYCISTIEKNTGEIDSLFIEQEYRKFGFGRQLVENSIKWLKANECKKIMVSVAEGHESVFDFYRKFEFYQRMTYLQLKA